MPLVLFFFFQRVCLIPYPLRSAGLGTKEDFSNHPLRSPYGTFTGKTFTAVDAVAVALPTVAFAVQKHQQQQQQQQQSNPFLVEKRSYQAPLNQRRRLLQEIGQYLNIL